MVIFSDSEKVVTLHGETDGYCKMTKIAFKTLGCRLNLYETDSIASQFKSNGYDIALSSENADVYIINTCTVTNTSDQKCRQAISQLRRNHPDALIVVTGCMVNHRKNELLKAGTADYVIDNERKSAIFDIISSHFSEGQSDPEGYDKDLFSYQPAYDTFHTRSLIKIQDGCNNFCSYCIIPMVRGRSTSRPAEDVITNIKEVLDHGFKEIVLTGVNMGRYLYENISFEKLIEDIIRLDYDFRLRISSIEPDLFSDAFADLFTSPKMAPHMHICLQSGCDATLKRMHRHYTTGQFARLCEQLRHADPLFNITTDMIVGFPGETEEEFKDSYDFAKEIGFSHIHTFRYSVRSGTLAEKMPDQIPEKTKVERSEVLREISRGNKLEYYKTMLGKTETLLIERFDHQGRATGYGEHYTPIIIEGKNEKRNTFRQVKLEEIIDNKNEEKILIKGYLTEMQ